MSQNQQRYTCVSKPGEYELVGTSSGAGTMKGFPVMVYRDVQTGRLFHREPENFMARMKKIPAEQTDINAELLAALESLLPFADDCTDEGPADSGWKSDELKKAITKASEAIAKAKGVA